MRGISARLEEVAATAGYLNHSEHFPKRVPCALGSKLG